MYLFMEGMHNKQQSRPCLRRRMRVNICSTHLSNVPGRKIPGHLILGLSRLIYRTFALCLSARNDKGVIIFLPIGQMKFSNCIFKMLQNVIFSVSITYSQYFEDLWKHFCCLYDKNSMCHMYIYISVCRLIYLHLSIHVHIYI